MADTTRDLEVVRVRGGARSVDADRTATEEPLEVRLHGASFAVIMRTPGADRELTAGFLLAERVIATPDDLGTIEYCTDPEQRTGRAENVVNVTLTGSARSALDRVLGERRQVTTNSSCGLCGRRTIESLAAGVAPLSGSWRFPGGALATCADRLRDAQRVFDATGGLHAAGLFSENGTLEQVAEDVGRHNAVDKVIGRMVIAEELPLSERLLFVSGRSSFEIVQKALFAGIPIVASVSAPSSLAVETADAFGMTLVGFVRGDAYNIYTHPHRIL